MEFLRKKIAGIPAWMWGLIIGGSIAAYAWITRGSKDTTTVAPSAPLSAVDYGAAGSAEDISGVPTIIPQTITPTSNPAWLRIVADGLVADGQDPVQVNNALTKVLGGLEVTAQEAALWSIAVRKYGQPPEGAPPIKTTTTPVVTTPIEPTKLVTVGEGTHVEEWLRLHGMSMEKLVALNPGIWANNIRAADLEGYESATNPLDPRYAELGFNTGTTPDSTIQVRVVDYSAM